MKQACHKLLVSLILSLSLLIPFAKTATAADMVSLTTSPVRIGDDNSLTLQPGEKKQVQIKVHNASDSELKVETRAIDFLIAADGETPQPVENSDVSNRWSLASWLTLAPAAHTLSANETATVNVLIEVPSDALPGGHYAMVYHEPQAGTVDDTSGAGISQRVGTLLYVIVAGDIKQEAYISKFDFPKFVENGPVDFAVMVDNQSDVHINAMPVVRIYNIFGKLVDNIKLEQKNVFPLSQRSFEDRWERVWGFGLYKAVAEVSYGNNGQIATATASMWMIPVRLILLVLIIILVLLILIISIRKHKQSGGEPQNQQLSAEDEQSNAVDNTSQDTTDRT